MTRSTLLPNQNYAIGSALLYSSDWGKEHLIEGKDYQRALDYDPSALFPVNIREVWPARDWGVRGFPAYQWNGYYGSGTPLAKRLPSTEITDLDVLTVTWDTAISGNANGLINLFLTKAANSMPEGSERAMEVMLFTNPSASARSWSRQGELVAKWSGWSMYERRDDWLKFCILPDKVKDAGSYDLKGSLKSLVGEGRLSPDLWFNGLAVGMEPVGGVCNMLIRSVKVAYAAKGKPAYA